MVDMELLKEIPFFRSLNENELIEISAIMEDINFPGNRIVFRQGEDSDCFFIVVGGEVAIKRIFNEKDYEIVRLGKGALLGEMGFMSGGHRSGTAKTLNKTKLLKLPKNEFNRLLEKRSFAVYKLIYHIAQVLSFRLARLGEQFAKLSEKNTFQTDEEKGILGHIKDFLNFE